MGRIQRLAAYNLVRLEDGGPIYYVRVLGEKAYLTRPLDDLMRVTELRIVPTKGFEVHIVLPTQNGSAV